MDSKIEFIKNTPLRFESIASTQLGNWGKMSAQHTVEHLTQFFNLSNGKVQMAVVSDEAHLEKLLVFLRSDKEFKENTKAPVLPELPLPLIYDNYKSAIQHLQNAIDAFFEYHQLSTNPITSHPVFGPLEVADWVLLHYKHVLHHCKQFSLI
jgi:hypothetical protein